MTRWTLALQEFDLEVIYKSGKHHQDADCLSRNAVEKAKEPTIDKDLNLLLMNETLDDLQELR